MIDLARRDGVTRLVLVRHGETEAAKTGVIAGRLDPPLSERGVEQVQAIGAWLSAAPLAAVYSSTSGRALASARVIAEPHGLEPVPEHDLREIDFGVIEGLTFAQVAERHPEIAAAWLSHPHELAFPGGECVASLRERVVRAVDAIVRRHPGAAAALVCHAGPIRLLVGDALGLMPAAAFQVGCRHGSVTVLDVECERRMVMALDVTCPSAADLAAPAKP
jgi:broad specificity phosphatase PhoE